MTVKELIEELQQQPGDNDLRFVEVRVTVHGPDAPITEMRCNISAVTTHHGELVINANGYWD